MKINPSVFREYDIRGVAGADFTQQAISEYEKWYGVFPGVTITLEAAKLIGQAYGTIIKRDGGQKVVVGKEIRPFADELTAAFIAGIRKTGCDVSDLGVALTPIVYFMTAYGKFDGGANVTGSHNVYFFNGFKLMKKDVWPLFGEELQEMHAMIERGDLLSNPEGGYQKLDHTDTYKKYLLEHVKLQRKLRVVVDCGNGSAGVFAPGILRSLGAEVIELFSEPDAKFPNHVPDPEARQTLTVLMEKVKSENADFGVAFDADGDRVGFVDEEGKFVDADLIHLILSKDVLSRFPGKKILYDVKCSGLFEELIPVYGGVPLMHRTGHAPIKETLRQDHDIILGGEVSGHFYFVEDYFRFDDGLFGAGRVMELFSKSDGLFSELFKDIPLRVRTPEIKLPCLDERKFPIIETIQKSFGTRYPSVQIDGIRLQISKTGWGLIRASNTSPYLTIRVEGESDAEVMSIKNILADELEKFPEISEKLNRRAVATLTGKLGWL
ncbi:MAG: phosphomannomutase/phosphoglucomutase [bacterium]|nr:phosphomannomutase/phosphoglucomutase [bacterium]